MNENILIAICKNLGSPIGKPSPVSGGLLHLMWRIQTTSGTYAVKQLSKDIILNEKVKKNYELNEKIASLFSQRGIPAICALAFNGHHLIEIDNTGYLIYPWVEAKALHGSEITEKHVLKVASLLAQMHQLNLQFPEISAAVFDVHSNEKIIALSNQALMNKRAFAPKLKEDLERIIALNDLYQPSIPLLKEHTVISHGDLDSKNILWDNNENPLLIDWESARKINPAFEIINAALDWSGITTAHFNKSLFDKMLQAYKKAGGKVDHSYYQAALYGVYGNWINWMVYNIERPQTDLGATQVEQVLLTLSKLSDELQKLT